MSEIIKQLLNGSLSKEQTKDLIDSFLNQNIGEATIGAYLFSTAMRAISSEELIGAVSSLRENMLKVDIGVDALDTAGTGGSGLITFNTSTASAFVCAAAGQPVAKHGNRAASSLCGSADIIEALGIRLDLNPEQLASCLKQTGFCFMFAPAHHSSTKRVAAVRRELGLRTIFNFIGPLSNPAQPSYQILGVSDLKMLEVIANALPALGTKKALVVRGEDGLDEISLSAETTVFEVTGEKIIKSKITPEQFGLTRVSHQQIEGKNATESAILLRKIFSGEKSAYSSLVALNAGAGLYVSGKAQSIKAGIEQANQILESKAALAVLNKVVDFCR